MRCSAFTLLETLLAISLTVSVGIAAVTLTTMQARLGVAAHAHEESLALITETRRLLDEDLVLAARQPSYGRVQVQEDGALRLATSCHLPGEPAGLHEVIWRFDAASGTVLRSSTPLTGGATMTRAVGRTWRLFTFVLDGETLSLNARTGVADTLWHLPLWNETP